MSNILENKSSRNNPFIVPHDYFDRLPERIMKRILAGYQAEDATPTGSVSSFGIPEAYFDKLENNILKRIALDQVSKENEDAFLEFASPTLFSQKKTIDFQVPENYFELLENSIRNRIRIDGLSDSDLDAGLENLSLPKQTGMIVPNFYFEELESKIWAKIESEQVEEELEDLYFSESAPILHSIPKANPFTVPAHYFNQLGQNLSETLVEEKSDSKIIPLPSSKPNPIIRYIGISIGVAASLALVFSLGNFLLNNNNGSQQVAGVENTIANPETPQNLPLAEVVSNEQTAAVVNFDEEDILEVVAENVELSDLSSINLEIDQPSQDEIIDYLVDTDIDIQSIDL